MYAFDGHMLSWGPWLQYATEIVMIVPVLIGLEQWIRNRKPLLFIISFSMLLISRNAAYLFIYSLYVMIYIIGRELYLDKNKRFIIVCSILFIIIGT